MVMKPGTGTFFQMNECIGTVPLSCQMNEFSISIKFVSRKNHEVLQNLKQKAFKKNCFVAHLSSFRSSPETLEMKAFYFDIKAPESGGRMQRLKMQVACIPVNEDLGSHVIRCCWSTEFSLVQSHRVVVYPENSKHPNASLS